MNAATINNQITSLTSGACVTFRGTRGKRALSRSYYVINVQSAGKGGPVVLLTSTAKDCGTPSAWTHYYRAGRLITRTLNTSPINVSEVSC